MHCKYIVKGAGITHNKRQVVTITAYYKGFYKSKLYSVKGGYQT